jgi:cell surface protein SprA
MIAKESKALILILSLFINSAGFAEYKFFAKKYSVLGDDQQEAYSQFDEYDKFHDIESIEPSGTIISQEYISSQPEEELPESVQKISGQEILDYFDVDKYAPMEYSQEKWRKKDKHHKRPPNTDLTNQPLPPAITAELPFESKLSLSGRKLIGFNHTSRVYDKEEPGKRKNNSMFKMEQELQMRVLGNIGERLNVNIDYDDTVGKKDISLVYKGKCGEFIKEAAFGDISVCMPATEFTGYKKELFGLKVDTEYKGLV